VRKNLITLHLDALASKQRKKFAEEERQKGGRKVHSWLHLSLVSKTCFNTLALASWRTIHLRPLDALRYE